MMTAPTGDNAFLHELELKVTEELTLAQANEPGEGAACAPIEEWLSDPADDLRYEVSLNALLGAVKAMEDGSRPGVAADDQDASEADFLILGNPDVPPGRS